MAELEPGVEGALDSINYDWDGFMPTMEALKFTTFIQEVNNGEGEDNKTPIVHTAMMEKVFNKKKRSLVLCHRGLGKRLPHYSGVLTPFGWTTMKDIKVGDSVINRHGETTVVSYKSEDTTRPTYRLHMSDGSSFDADEDHLHIVWPYRKKDRERRMTTKELVGKRLVNELERGSDQKDPNKSYNYVIPLCEPIKYPHSTDMKYDPYVMGVMLADGHFGTRTVSCHLDDMIITAKEFANRGYPTKQMRITSENGGRFTMYPGVFKEYKEWVFDKKHIPAEYLVGSVSQRTDLLRGLMDGDGSIRKNGSSIYHSVNKNLADDVVKLVQSLGGISYIRTYIRSDKDCQEEYQVVVNIKINPFLLGRKADKWKPTKKVSRAIVRIEEIGETTGNCIQVESDDHSFITDNYTITSNTTLFAEYLFMHIAAFGYMPGFGKVNLALYISDSVENGVKNLRRNIEHRYGNSEMMQKMVPNRKIFVGNNGVASRDVTSDDDYKDFEADIGAGKKFTDIRLEFKNWKGHTFVVKGYGAAQGVRGSKELGMRPQLAIFDDILSDTDARSPTIISTINDTVYKAVSKALDPGRQKQIWLGTPFNQNDPIYEAAESGAWELACYPIAQDFDSSTTPETFKGSWPERFGYDYVKDEFDTAMKLGRPHDFYQELMLRISNSDDRLVKDSDIVKFNRNAMIANKGSLNYYITTDAATTDSSTADYSVIMVWGINNNGDILLMDWWFGKVLLNEFINNLFRLVGMWKQNLLGVGIEVSGQQGGTISTIKDKMIRENNYFFLLTHGNGNKEGIRPAQGTRKYERFQTMQPLFSTKKIWFPDDVEEDPFMIELMNELRYVGTTNTGRKIGKAKNDDILDCIAMLSMITLIKPMMNEVAPIVVSQDSNYFAHISEPSDQTGWESYSI